MMGLGFAGLAWGLRAGRAQRRPSVNSRLIFINADQTAMLFGGAQRITDAIAKARAARVDGVGSSQILEFDASHGDLFPGAEISLLKPLRRSHRSP